MGEKCDICVGKDGRRRTPTTEAEVTLGDMCVRGAVAN